MYAMPQFIKFKVDFGGFSFKISFFFDRNMEVPDMQLMQIFVFFKDSIVCIVNKIFILCRSNFSC